MNNGAGEMYRIHPRAGHFRCVGCGAFAPVSGRFREPETGIPEGPPPVHNQSADRGLRQAAWGRLATCAFFAVMHT
jgi:hypothetical protein